jgi:hypothetical protein
MKIAKMLTMAALVAMAARAEQSLTVYLNPADVPTPVLYSAKHTAAKMLAVAGVRIEFRNGEPSTLQLQRDGAIFVRLANNTPNDLLPGALAFTRVPESVEITVFYDRMARFDLALRQALLAHLLAHEIAHILQGIDRHSESRVLKAKWTSDDHLNMVRQPLSFTQEDIRLIQTGLAKRTARALVAGK